MDKDLTIRTLGTLNITSQGLIIGDRLPRKSLALLIYLAFHPGMHDRDDLTTLLWEDSLTSGSSNLRVALHKLNEEFAPYLTVTRQSVGLVSELVKLDARLLEAGLAPLLTTNPLLPTLSSSAERSARDGLALYGGPLLMDFEPVHAPRFGAWVASERDRLQQLVRNACRRLCQDYLTVLNYAAAAELAERWFAIDATNEEPVRILMRLMQQAGKPAAGLAYFAELSARLQLQMRRPEPETISLSHELLQAAPTAEAARVLAHESGLASVGAPIALTPILGRSEELLQLERQVMEPGARLISLIGLGGVGKTRLALELVRRLRVPSDIDVKFPDGIYVVALEGLTQADELVQWVASAINLRLAGPVEARRHLMEYMADKRILLVLDNFEQLVANGAEVVKDLLDAASSSKILVTSRVPLGFLGERVVELYGLAHPTSEESTRQLQYFPACSLFLELAFPGHRAALTEEDAEAVARICRCLDGLPLGIQLAAALTRIFSYRYVAESIERDMDFLTSELRDLPDRQRSLRAVFDYSWRLLNGQEKQAYTRLAVFHGDFGIDAAMAVAGVSPSLLLSLVYRSLVQVVEANGLHPEADRRYRLHPVLRQFIAREMMHQSRLERETRLRHAAFFADLAARCDVTSGSEDMLANLKFLRREEANLLAAWQYAFESGRLELLDRMTWNLAHYVVHYGPFTKGIQLFRSAVDALSAGSAGQEHKDLSLGRMLACLAIFLNHNAEYAAAFSAAQTALAVDGLEPAARSVALLESGRALFFQGSFAQARQLLATAFAAAQEAGAIHWQVRAQVMLGRVLLYLGEHELGTALCTEAVNACRTAGLKLDTLRALNQLGICYYYQGRYQAAQSCFDRVMELSKPLDERHALILTTNAFGAIAHQLGDYTKARIFYNQALSLQMETGDTNAQAKVLANLSLTAHLMGNQESARQYAHDALALALERGLRDEEAYIVGLIGRIRHAQGNLIGARQAFEEARALRLQMGQIQQSMWALGGLALVALDSGDPDLARTLAEQMLPTIMAPTFALSVDPFYDFWACYQALAASEDPRAADVLARAYERLTARAGQIDEPELREAYLYNVALHGAIIAAYKQSIRSPLSQPMATS